MIFQNFHERTGYGIEDFLSMNPGAELGQCKAWPFNFGGFFLSFVSFSVPIDYGF